MKIFTIISDGKLLGTIKLRDDMLPLPANIALLLTQEIRGHSDINTTIKEKKMDTKFLRDSTYMKKWWDQVGIQAANEIDKLRKTYGHVHVNNEGDVCRVCGLDLRDRIHRIEDKETQQSQKGDCGSLSSPTPCYKWINCKDEMPDYGLFVLFCLNNSLHTTHLGWLESAKDTTFDEDMWFSESDVKGWINPKDVNGWFAFPCASENL